VAALADPSPASLDAAAAAAPLARRAESLAGLLGLDLDGLVIATPSALHAEQAITALGRGVAVFCQKPLARSAPETRRVIDAARRANRLLQVDLSYRFTDAFARIAASINAGDLGHIYAADLTFHNAYGPDKPWFKDPAQSGGGCMIDLGVHLIDLALLALGGPRVDMVTSRLFCKGRPLSEPRIEVEDYAVAELSTESGAHIRLACSWWLHAGRDAVIEANFHGAKAGASLHNVGGSFFDFRADLFRGTSAHTLAEPPDAWGGRAITAWAEQLARSPRFDPAIESVYAVAQVLDSIYGRGPHR
jgi:predicted dehydrogenase